MEAGYLNRRIAIESRSEIYDELGQPIEVWLPILSIWGNVRHLSGVASIKAGANTSIVQASIRIRPLSGINAAMRVKYAGKIYGIKAVLPNKRYTDLVCELVQ